MSLPNLFLCGAPRSGTTALYRALQSCRLVGCPERKEPLYYCVASRDRFSGPKDYQGVRDWQEYLSVYGAFKGFKYVVDGSTLYLSCREACERLKERGRGIRLVAVLRNPVNRIWSHYCQHKRQGRETCNSVLAALDAEDDRIARGWSPFWAYGYLSRYDLHLRMYRWAIEREQLLIILYEALQNDGAAELKKIEKFLGISFPSGVMESVENPGGKVRLPWVEEWVRNPKALGKGAIRRMVPRGWRLAVGRWLLEWNTVRANLGIWERSVLRERFSIVKEVLGREYGLPVDQYWMEL